MSRRERLESAYAAHHTGHARYGFSYRATERGPLFAAWVGTDKRLLDLGCRDGHLTQYYATGNVVTGVDIDQQALSRARENLGISTIWLDLNHERLPIDGDSFDVVVAGEVLEHLVDPAFIVGEARRVLTPSGVLIGSVPNSFHWRARLAFLAGRSIDDPTHLHLFSQSEVLRLLEGFNNVELVPVGGIGGRMLPVVPAWISHWLVRGAPTVFANDFLFRATK
jgi:2-polyprenyl-3-methyl-5-hydroxy-6-metoxy-1,4-benzoquinol methylase